MDPSPHLLSPLLKENRFIALLKIWRNFFLLLNDKKCTWLSIEFVTVSPILKGNSPHNFFKSAYIWLGLKTLSLTMPRQPQNFPNEGTRSEYSMCACWGSMTPPSHPPTPITHHSPTLPVVFTSVGNKNRWKQIWSKATHYVTVRKCNWWRYCL